MRNKTAPSFVTPEIISGWNDWNYQVVVCGKRIRCLIVGELHYRPEHISKQLELIELVKPEFVLHEFGPAWIYDPQGGGYRLQSQRSIRDGIDNDSLERFPELLTQQAERLNHKIVGIDLTTAELDIALWRLTKERPDEFEWKQVGEHPFDGCIIKRDDPDYEFTTQDPLIMELREARMVKEIGRFEKISKAPIVVIVGDCHAENFYTHGLFRGCRFGYVVIHQTKLNRAESKTSYR